ncbi:hypothetical protein ACSBR2_017883 [Camellia fascicularis]
MRMLGSYRWTCATIFGTERRARVVDGDAEGALAYLCGKEEQDPMFYYKYDVDEENRLNNLFWTDGGSRTDYLCFGDVLMFDTTYWTNAYNKPFVILQGVSLRLFELVRAYDRALARLRHNEAKAQSEIENTTHILFTESTWNVQYRPSDNAMKCSCLHFESCGIPCSHMVSIMNMEHLKEIPSSCILRRWTKNVKSFTLLGKTPFPEWVLQTTRFGAL